MERPETKFDKNSRAWIGLTGVIPPWTFARCFKTPHPRNNRINQTITFEGFDSQRETYDANQTFVEHRPNTPRSGIISPPEFSDIQRWHKLTVSRLSLTIYNDRKPDIDFYAAVDPGFIDINKVKFNKKGPCLIVEAEDLRQKGYKGIRIKPYGPPQNFSIDGVDPLDCVIKDLVHKALVVFWGANEKDRKMSTYLLSRHDPDLLDSL